MTSFAPVPLTNDQFLEHVSHDLLENDDVAIEFVKES